jgi:hypothetical protein
MCELQISWLYESIISGILFVHAFFPISVLEAFCLYINIFLLKPKGQE